MTFSILLLVIAVLFVIAYVSGARRARSLVTPGVTLNSLPGHYGSLVALWTCLPPLLLMLCWGVLETPVIDRLLAAQLPAEVQAEGGNRISLALSKVRNLAGGANVQADPELAPVVLHLKDLQSRNSMLSTTLVLALALAGFGFGLRRLAPALRARNEVESIVKVLLFCSSGVAVLTTVGILSSVLYEAWMFFGRVPVFDFLFGTTWSPQVALRADQSGSSGSFGAVPLFAGTLMISMIAMFIAVPIGLMSAIYLSEYATPRVRSYAKPALEVLAGIPTVVYGFFAALTVAPILKSLGADVGLEVSSESALAAGLVMGVMIIPFVSSLSDDVINAVPQALRDGSYGLGATQSETIRQVVIPAALPGIVGAVMLAVSRAIGETMIVAMAAGLAANLTANPLDSVTTVTVQIVTLLVGDQEFDSSKTLAAFALGLVLFLVTLILNYVALKVVQKYREQYD
ncbi:phosphate ABC transporter permease subunit PstC [Oceanobacter sp. 4_MG-2023]|uniref:phosphate ABC transporter permease subunit PstC n=1 Tax=Oceanobacter sp. 4_MG-2023 TaxID=3062623 RepID=UPI0027346FBD|nr:phosphate ABC transporter permease subunit PstC [Oceanobacter sp. 4_MG-2023]MDP2547780.1 phosphate ABC transporter permease subunit PstC [Oceanobacter sp. 4_MG-2023]